MRSMRQRDSSAKKGRTSLPDAKAAAALSSAIRKVAPPNLCDPGCRLRRRGNGVQPGRVRLEPRASRPPLRHDRDEQVQRREARAEKPGRAGLRLHHLPKPPRVGIDVGLEGLLRILAWHKASGNIGIGEGRIDVGDQEYQPAEELRPWRRWNEIVPARGLREMQGDCRTLGHDLAVRQRERWDLHQRIDRTQLLARPFVLEEIANLLEPVEVSPYQASCVSIS